MEKEKVTEELVRQNGNQAAAVIADYAGQGGGGGGGSTGGIPTIDKNIQPNIVWREPTEEDSAKFHSHPILRVADLSEGKLPLFLVMKMTDEGEEYINSFSVLSVQLPGEGMDGAVDGADDFSALIAEDWSLLGILGED